MRNLIINADDFGMSAEVNEGIKRAIKLGIVSNVSLMVNLPFFDDAICFLKDHPGVSVGLHFNVTEGGPVLPPSEVGGLLEEGNHFIFWRDLIPKLILRKALIKQVKKEFLAQYQKLVSTGLSVSHIDGHHHLHLYPAVFRFVTEFATKEGIKSLRCCRINFWGMTAGIGKRPTLTQLLVNVVLWVDGILFNHRHLGEVDGLYDVNWDSNLSEAELLKILENIPEGTTKLICHLGVVSAAGNRRFLEPRQRCLRMLCGRKVRRYLTHSDIRLLRHGDDAPLLAVTSL